MEDEATKGKPTVLLLILEHHFIESEGRVYTDVQCNADFWERYLKEFDQLIVCARLKSLAHIDEEKLCRSDKRNVRFIGLPDFLGFSGLVKNYWRVRKIIRMALAACDGVMLRAPSPLAFVAEPLIRKSGRPWAVEMALNPRTAYSRDSIDHPLQPLIQKYAVRLTKKICMEADGVAYVTEHVLQDEYPCRAIRGSGELASGFTASYSTIELRKEDYSKVRWGDSPPSTLWIAHSGKMVDNRKGHILFLDIIGELRRRGLNVRAVLIGDGPNRRRLEEHAQAIGIRDCCDFVGWKVGFSGLKTDLQRARLFVFPTMSEGLPRAVVEAMASGLLCIGSNVDGMSELLEGPCMCAERSAGAYADIVESFLRDWQAAGWMRDRQYERAKDFSANLLERRRTIFYRSLRNKIEGR